MNKLTVPLFHLKRQRAKPEQMGQGHLDLI